MDTRKMKLRLENISSESGQSQPSPRQLNAGNNFDIRLQAAAMNEREVELYSPKLQHVYAKYSAREEPDPKTVT